MTNDGFGVDEPLANCGISATVAQGGHPTGVEGIANGCGTLPITGRMRLPVPLRPSRVLRSCLPRPWRRPAYADGVPT